MRGLYFFYESDIDRYSAIVELFMIHYYDVLVLTILAKVCARHTPRIFWWIMRTAILRSLFYKFNHLNCGHFFRKGSRAIALGYLVLAIHSAILAIALGYPLVIYPLVIYPIFVDIS